MTSSPFGCECAGRTRSPGGTTITQVEQWLAWIAPGATSQRRSRPPQPECLDVAFVDRRYAHRASPGEPLPHGAGDRRRREPVGLDQFLVGRRVDEGGPPAGAERVDGDDALKRGRGHVGTAPVDHLEEILQDVAVVLFGQADQPPGPAQLDQQVFVDRRHVDDADADALRGARRRCRQCLVHAAAAAHDDRAASAGSRTTRPCRTRTRSRRDRAPPRACA